MIKRTMLATVAICALAIPALAQDAPTRDTVVATVNGNEITLGQMIVATAQLPPEYRQLAPEVLFDGIMNQLIQQQLLADTVETMPARVAISLENDERSLMAGEALRIIADSAIGDEAVQAKYNELYAPENAQTEYNAAHILVATEEEALAVKARIEAGEDFATVAREVSTDTGSGANGGDLGWFTQGMMVQPFEEAVMGAEPGVLTGPIPTQFGWHLIILRESRLQEAPPLDVVRAQIEGELEQAAIEARLAELEAAAEVTRPEPGAFDPILIGTPDLLAD